MHSPRFLLVSLALAWALASAPPIAAKRRAATATVPRIPFTRYTLPNGLQVILHRDPRLPLVTVNVWYHVGAVDERPGRTGFAHLFEHVMFEGSAHVGNDMHFRYLQLAGASDVNGSTGDDRTNYYETVPRNQLALALWLESDRMGYLLPALTQAKLDGQRRVVKNERRQRYDNRPYGVADERLCQALFPKPHPYHGCVIGTMHDLSAATLGDVKQFFRRHYGPANATLVLAGDFEPAQAKRLIKKYFGPLKSAPRIKRVYPKPPVLTKVERIQLTDRVPFPKVMLGWVTAPLYQPGDATLDLLATVLSHGKASRLYRSLVYRQQVAQSVSASQRSAMGGSMFVITGLAAGNHTAQQVEAALWAQLERVARRGVTRAELARARTVIETQLFRGLQTLSGRADQLQAYNLFAGDPGYLPKDLARYRRVRPRDLKRMAERLVKARGRVVIVVNPRAPAKKGAHRPGAAKGGAR